MGPEPQTHLLQFDERASLGVSLNVVLDAGSPRLAFGATVDNAADDHRLRILFPAGTAAGTARSDTAFGVVERPARKPEAVSSAPLQSVVDAGDSGAGVIVCAEGLAEYEVLPGDESSVTLTLLRCVGDLSRADLETRRGHAGPGLPTPAFRTDLRERRQEELRIEGGRALLTLPPHRPSGRAPGAAPSA